VQVSIDDPTFENPVAATLNDTATAYSTAVPTPPLGKHTVYARARQGFDTSTVASAAITVKR
jgi:hypothetical protein